MNKGFKFYYKDGLAKARGEFKKKKNIGKFYAYLLSSFIGRIILFLFMPAFTLSDYKLANMVKEGKDITLSKVYSAMDRPKTFWTCVLTGINELLIFLGGILIIIIPTAILSGVGFVVSFMLNDQSLMLPLTIGLGIPGALVLLVYLIIFPFYLAPVYYIISSVDGINASDVLKNSFQAMKTGKGTLFGILFVNGLMLTIFTLLIGGAGYALVMFLPVYLYNMGIINDTLFTVVRGAGILVSVFLGLLYLKILANRITAVLVSTVELFDGLLAKYKSSLEGVYIKGTYVEKVAAKNYKENLVRLFDETTGYSKYAPSYFPQEEVESLGEATPEEINEEYLKNQKELEKLAAKAHEEMDANEATVEEEPREDTSEEVEAPEDTEMEVKSERTLSKADLKAQMKLAKKQAKEEAKKAKQEEKDAKKGSSKKDYAEEEPVEELSDESFSQDESFNEAPLDEAPSYEDASEEAPASTEPSYDESEPSDEPLTSDEPQAEDNSFSFESSDEPQEEAEAQAQEPSEENNDFSFGEEEPKAALEEAMEDASESSDESEDLKFDESSDDIDFSSDDPFKEE